MAGLSATAEVIYGRPGPAWSTDEKIDWLIARVVPIREELTATREEMRRLEGIVANVRDGLGEFVAGSISESHIEYIRARNFGLLLLAVGLICGVVANLTT